MAIHEAAARGFGAGADDYERGRPEYPPAAVAYLVEMLRMGPGTTVVDLAAGTGKLTRLLVPSGADVVAVEPVAEMRGHLHTTVRGVTVLEGTAEAIPLEDRVATAVTVGQAFHWFRGEQAVPEIHRVLRAGGRLGLVWNRRDLDDPVQREIQEVIEPYRRDTPSHAGGAWREALDRSHLFGDLVERRFPMEQLLDADGLAARVFSTSFMAVLPPTERAVAERAVRQIALRHGGVVVTPYVTECYWAEAV